MEKRNIKEDVLILINEFGIKKGYIAKEIDISFGALTRKLRVGNYSKLEANAIYAKWGCLLNNRK